MSDEPDSLTLRLLRRLDEKLDRVIDDLGDLKIRVTSIEEGLAGVNRRMDRFESRLDRIERRIGLVES
jgi:archaellum component FlaC